jgi:hypothetical protein
MSEALIYPKADSKRYYQSACQVMPSRTKLAFVVPRLGKVEMEDELVNHDGPNDATISKHYSIRLLENIDYDPVTEEPVSRYELVELKGLD